MHAKQQYTNNECEQEPVKGPSPWLMTRQLCSNTVAQADRQWSSLPMPRLAMLAYVLQQSLLLLGRRFFLPLQPPPLRFLLVLIKLLIRDLHAKDRMQESRNTICSDCHISETQARPRPCSAKPAIPSYA